MTKRLSSIRFTCTAALLAAALIFSASCAAPEDTAGATTIPNPEKIGGTAAISGDSISFVIFFPSTVSNIVAKASVTPPTTITGSVVRSATNYAISSASYNSSTGTLTASTVTISNISFTITGTYSAAGGFTGTLTENNNGTPTIGSLTGVGTTASAEISNYFGTFTSSAAFAGTRTWNLTISGTMVSGTYYEKKTSTGTVIYGTTSGTRSSDTITGTFKPTSGSTTALSGSLTGTISGSNISGTWSALSGGTTYTGDFSGTKP